MASDVSEKSLPETERLKGDNLSDFSYDSEDESGSKGERGGGHDTVTSNFMEIERTVTRSDDNDSLSGSRTFDCSDEASGKPSSALFIRNDILAFKSKKDFAVETEETVSARHSPIIKFTDQNQRRL